MLRRSPSSWKVMTEYVDDKPIYTVYRLKDVASADIPSNRQFGWRVKDKSEAEKIAARENQVRLWEI